VDRVVFSEPGIRLIPRVAPALKRAYNVILNNELTPTYNGEYWLIGQFPNDGVYVDVGYHRGEWSANVLAQHPGARIVAFDPWPDASGYYESSPQKKNIEFYAVALADRDGTSTFYDYRNACNSLARRDLQRVAPENEYPVTVTTLDAWCREHDVRYIDLLKVDVEGYDLPVLEGAVGLLNSGAIGAFVFEYDDAWIYSRRLLGDAATLIEAAGYQLAKLFNGFVVPFEYRIDHETFGPAMYVGISPELRKNQTIPTRNFAL
jgi:FkbM family methyltransferase